MTAAPFGKSQLLANHSWALLLVALAASVAPVWTVSLPPATDLPQHLSQIFLLKETLAGHRPDLTITPWYFPNTLIYVLIFAFWNITDPIMAGRLVFSALAGLWIASTYLLCKSRQRPVENWLICAPLVFNFLFYWGLLNFLIGWPIFCIFIAMASKTEDGKNPKFLFLAALLLYYAHALWFLMANVWLATQLIDGHRRPWVKSLIPMLPGWLLAFCWYPQLVKNRGASGADTGIIWGPMPLEKLAPNYITDSVLGGLRSQLESTFLIFLGLWIAASLITRREYLEREIDRPIFVAALIFILSYWIFPSAYMNTIFFNQRWLPCGIVLLVLSLPSPKIRLPFLYTLGIGWTLVFSTASIVAWREWETEQLSGLTEAIAKIDEHDRVFGLDMLGGSLFIKGSPGLQIFSYAQAIKGAELNFSFVEHYSGIVQHRTEQGVNPNQKLIWTPLKVRKEHLSGFDKVLIGGDPSLHAYARERLGVEENSSTEDTWRVYQIKR